MSHYKATIGNTTLELYAINGRQARYFVKLVFPNTPITDLTRIGEATL